MFTLSKRALEHANRCKQATLRCQSVPRKASEICNEVERKAQKRTIPPSQVDHTTSAPLPQITCINTIAFVSGLLPSNGYLARCSQNRHSSHYNPPCRDESHQSPAMVGGLIPTQYLRNGRIHQKPAGTVGTHGIPREGAECHVLSWEAPWDAV